MPEFSIVIPVYNVAPYLRECLDSVLAQTFTDWEAICVDDGSTDGSGEILDEYAAKDGRFRVIHQENAGVSAARNAALDAAGGEWLVFLDGDDVLRQDALQRVMDVSRQEPADIIRYEHFRVGDDDSRPSGTLPFCRLDVRAEILGCQMDGTYLITWHNAFKRCKCQDIRFKPYVCGEDRLYTFECLQRMSLLVHVPDCLYGYRSRPLSYTTSVIKTFRGWEGELAYRLEFLDMAAKSAKKIEYSKAQWLTRYLSSLYCEGFMVSKTLSDEEKRKLFVRWQEALPVLMGYSAFSLFQRLELGIQRILCTYGRVEGYFRVRQWLFGPQCGWRRIYRRIRRHGEFAKVKL